MTKKNSLLYVLLAVAAVFFFINRFLLLVAGGLVLILLYIMLKKGKTVLYLNGITKLFMAISLMCIIHLFLSTFFNYSELGSGSYIVKELARCSIYLLLVQILLNISIHKKDYIFIWNILLIITVTVAILQFTKIVDMNSILENFYGESVQLVNARKSELASFRCGSVFINPNVFACFLVAGLGCHLIVSKDLKFSFGKNLFLYLFYLIGFILSGSRTGLVLAIIVILYYLRFEAKYNIWVVLKFLIGIVFAFLAVFIIIQILDPSTMGAMSELRMFKIDEGVTNSLDTKISILKKLIGNMNIVNYIIGYGPFDYSAAPGLLVDFDSGYFIVYYGIVGVLFYIILLRSILLFHDKQSSRKMSNMMMAIVLIFGFTAGIYFNLRIFAIYLLMFLPVLLDDRIREV